VCVLFWAIAGDFLCMEAGTFQSLFFTQHPQTRFPPSRKTQQVARVNKMLGDEYGTASNIKSRVNRLSVLSAITSAQQRLKLYNKVGVGSSC